MENSLEDFLLEDIKKKIESSFISNGWVKVYFSDFSDYVIENAGIKGYLIDVSKTNEALEDDEPFGSSDEEFESLVHYRWFIGSKDSYLELSEEFRLDYNLYEDYKSPRKKDYLYINRINIFLF
jgi:hypothetical protein